MKVSLIFLALCIILVVESTAEEARSGRTFKFHKLKKASALSSKHEHHSKKGAAFSKYRTPATKVVEHHPVLTSKYPTLVSSVPITKTTYYPSTSFTTLYGRSESVSDSQGRSALTPPTNYRRGHYGHHHGHHHHHHGHFHHGYHHGHHHGHHHHGHHHGHHGHYYGWADQNGEKLIIYGQCIFNVKLSFLTWIKQAAADNVKLSKCQNWLKLWFFSFLIPVSLHISCASFKI